MLLEPLSSDLSLFTVLFSGYCAYLAAWIIYQRFFSSLARFGGPVWASISIAWRQWHSWRGALTAELNQWHRLKGDVVRIGPNELYVVPPLAVPMLISPQKHIRSSAGANHARFAS